MISVVLNIYISTVIRTIIAVIKVPGIDIIIQVSIARRNISRKVSSYIRCRETSSWYIICIGIAIMENGIVTISDTMISPADRIYHLDGLNRTIIVERNIACRYLCQCSVIFYYIIITICMMNDQSIIMFSFRSLHDCTRDGKTHLFITDLRSCLINIDI